MKPKLVQPHVRLLKGENTFELLKDHSAFILFTFISLRAKRAGDFSIHGLEIGEAMLGDFETYGMTESVYRTAKKNLRKYGIISTRTTNKGTIAKILCKTIFNINDEAVVEKLTDRSRTDDDYQEGKEYKEEELLSKDNRENSKLGSSEKKVGEVTHSTLIGNSEEPLQNSAKVSPKYGNEDVNAMLLMLGNFCQEKFGRKVFSDKAGMLRINASNLVKLKLSHDEIRRRLGIIIESESSFKIGKMKSVYGIYDLVKHFDKSDELEAKKRKELNNRIQSSNQPKEGSVLARWEKQSSVVNLPTMQKIEASTVVPKQQELTQEQQRLRSLQERIRKLGESRGIEMTFGFSSATFSKIAYLSDENIIEESKAMLELEIRKLGDLPATERKPLKKFPIGERQLLARIQRPQSAQGVNVLTS